MDFIADLHIHSRFSRATSRNLTLSALHRSALLKGITVVGTGDVTHPGWFAELEAELEPAEEGLFRLREEIRRAAAADVPSSCQREVRFLLSSELSSIYKRDGRTRKVHNLVLLPSLDAARRFTERIARIGNVRSDGRPILGLDARDLLEIVLETDPQACLIPAHIWTPWFSVLGSFSGFDSLTECFGPLTPHIFAVETGLSSDPPMNWRLSALDGLTLISNSDAHSPEKLGREANRFGCELAYPALLEAMRSRPPGGMLGTVEFFPEEGKYHLDGHRNCGVRLAPEETLAGGGLCPVCGKPVTVGVMHRVVQLADRPVGARPASACAFQSLIPLAEVVGELLGQGAATQGVHRVCDTLIRQLGPELSILREVAPEEVRRVGPPLLGEALRRMREGRVISRAGFDGEYGVIRLFEEGELEALGGRSLFGEEAPRPVRQPPVRRGREVGVAEPPPLPYQPTSAPPAASAVPQQPVVPDPAGDQQPGIGGPQPPPATGHWPPAPEDPLLAGLNEQQREVVCCTDPVPLLVVAGPGTGKTRTLTHRLAYRLREGLPPDAILAVTFTVKAAAELTERLEQLIGRAAVARMTVGTFHAICYRLLRVYHAAVGLPQDFKVLDTEAQLALLEEVAQSHGLLPAGRRSLRRDLEQWSLWRARHGAGPWPAEPAESLEDAARVNRLWQAYRQELSRRGCVDLDGLPEEVLRLLTADLFLRHEICGRWRLVAVDEYQDVNRTQVRLVRLWAGDGAGLCAIGDPDQAIYGFRGAARAHFLRFTADWPATRVVRLERSYRSTDTILQASRQALGPVAHDPRPLWSGLTGERQITIRQAPTERAEAEGVVQLIEQAVGGTGFFSLDSGRVGGGAGGGLGFGDIAVLYRTHSLAGPLEEALERSGIPYQVGGALDRQREQLLLLGGLRALLGRASPAELDRLGGAAMVEQRLALLAPGSAALPLAGALDRLRPWLAGLPDVDARRLETAASRLLRLVPADTELAIAVGQLALLREGDDLDPRADRVQLMTLHASKGLEFELVFVIGCEDGLLPFGGWHGPAAPEEVEEERRLLYVGMTRARQQLVLTWAARRAGQPVSERQPSPFLADIAQELARREQSGWGGRRSEPSRQLGLEL